MLYKVLVHIVKHFHFVALLALLASAAEDIWNFNLGDLAFDLAFLINLTVTNRCALTKLEQYFRKKAGMKQISGWVSSYFGKGEK